MRRRLVLPSEAQRPPLPDYLLPATYIEKSTTLNYYSNDTPALWLNERCEGNVPQKYTFDFQRLTGSQNAVIAGGWDDAHMWVAFMDDHIELAMSTQSNNWNRFDVTVNTLVWHSYVMDITDSYNVDFSVDGTVHSFHTQSPFKFSYGLALFARANDVLRYGTFGRNSYVKIETNHVLTTDLVGVYNTQNGRYCYYDFARQMIHDTPSSAFRGAH